MLKISLILVFIFFSSITYASKEDSKMIRSKIQIYIDGWKKYDGKEFAKPFAKDASFINIFTMKLKGKAAIAKRHQEIFDGFLKGTVFKAQNIDIRYVSNNLAIVLVDWTLENLNCRPKKPCPKKGTFTDTFHKKNNGNWLIEATQNTMTPPKFN